MQNMSKQKQIENVLQEIGQFNRQLIFKKEQIEQFYIIYQQAGQQNESLKITDASVIRCIIEAAYSFCVCESYYQRKFKILMTPVIEKDSTIQDSHLYILCEVLQENWNNPVEDFLKLLQKLQSLTKNIDKIVLEEIKQLKNFKEIMKYLESKSFFKKKSILAQIRAHTIIGRISEKEDLLNSVLTTNNLSQSFFNEIVLNEQFDIGPILQNIQNITQFVGQKTNNIFVKVIVSFQAEFIKNEFFMDQWYFFVASSSDNSFSIKNKNGILVISTEVHQIMPENQIQLCHLVDRAIAVMLVVRLFLQENHESEIEWDTDDFNKRLCFYQRWISINYDHIMKRAPN